MTTCGTGQPISRRVCTRGPRARHDECALPIDRGVRGLLLRQMVDSSELRQDLPRVDVADHLVKIALGRIMQLAKLGRPHRAVVRRLHRVARRVGMQRSVARSCMPRPHHDCSVPSRRRSPRSASGLVEAGATNSMPVVPSSSPAPLSRCRMRRAATAGFASKSSKVTGLIPNRRWHSAMHACPKMS